MKVVILGGGRVGFHIAQYFAFQENDVTIIDQSVDLLKKIGETLDVQPVVGTASHPDILYRAGAQDADLLIAVTGSDEVNIVACEVAHSLFNIPLKIARIRNQHYMNPTWSRLFTPETIAIDVIISPEMEVAHNIARSIGVEGAFEVLSLAQNRLKVIGLRCLEKAQAAHTPLRFLPSLFPELNFTIVCISRGETTFIPTMADQIQPHDDVYFAVDVEDLAPTLELFGYHHHQGRRVVLVGGGNIGLAIAREMEQNSNFLHCKIIERTPTRAEYIAQRLRETEVICGDALDYDVLREVSLEEVETLVSVTDDDKVNILSALLAKRTGVNRALCLLNNMGYTSLVKSIGIDSVINPQSITVSTILRHVREGRVRSVHALKAGEVELIEAEARETSNIIGLTVEDVNIAGKVMVCALIRDNHIVFLPTKMVIHIGDYLILAVAKDTIAKIQKIFVVRAAYL